MLWQMWLLLIVTWMLVERWRKRKYYKLTKQLKNSFKSYPFVGHAYMFVGTDEDRMTAANTLGLEAIRQGGATTAWLGGRLYVIISDPAIAEPVLKNCLEKDDIVRFMQFVLGNGSIFAPVSIWRPRRKILAPTFTARNLEKFVSVFAARSEELVERLRHDADQGPCSIWTPLATYSMNAICETTLGIQVNAQKDPEQLFLKALDDYCQLVSARMFQPWLHSNAVYGLLPSFKRLKSAKECMCNFIEQTIKLNHRVSNDNRHTFLDLLVKSSGGEDGYSDQELQEETLVIIIAGTDTSAVGAAFTLLLLAQHQDVQEKVFQELLQVFGDADRPVELNDLNRLIYLDAVIKESLRLYPPGPLIVRTVVEDIMLPSGVTLPAGCGVLIHNWAIHRNPYYWDIDVDAFRPERFFEPLKHPAQFMAFSHGPRNCIGYKYAMMSMKSSLATVLRHYRLMPGERVCAGVDKPIRVKFDIMMKHVDNYIVQLEMRK